MKVGIIGTGFMGVTHAAGWAQTPAQICGFCAETTAEAAPLAKQYHSKIYTSIDEMLPEVDVVDLCTPTFLHAEQVEKAARAGKDIICEKPLALDVQTAVEMLAVCQKMGVRLFVAHVVRFFPEYAKAKAIVDSGKIGRPGTIHLRRCNYRPKKPVGNWFPDEQKSGGLLLDLSVHDFDYARWIAGDVKNVFSKKVSSMDPEAPIDYALTILTHENGTLSHITGGWAYPPPNFQTGFDINCDRGNIHWDSAETDPVHVLIRTDQDSPDVGLVGSHLIESPYTTEIKEFYDAIQNHKEARVTSVDGMKAVQIAAAARKSAECGEPVMIDSMKGEAA